MMHCLADPGLAEMKELEAANLQDLNGIYAILFWAPWAQPSVLVEQLMDDQAPLNVDEQKDLVQLFQIESVPSIVILIDGKIATKYQGSDPIKILGILQETLVSPVPLDERLKSLINKHPFMIFIKGTPSAPRCGFTSTLLRHLKQLQVDFDYFDILQDDEVRQGLKELSNWPTYPQIYVNGELLGGLDIFTDMLNSGELQPILDSIKA